MRRFDHWQVAAALVAGDQLTKYLAQQLLSPLELGPFSYGAVINRQGLFGLQVSNELLVGLGVLIIVAMVILLLRGASNTERSLGYWLLLGGAASNLLDRVLVGGVVDVIGIGDLTHFNLADVMILLGAVSLVRGLLKPHERS